MLSVHPATQAQHDKVFPTDKSFDSEGHCHVLPQSVSRFDHAAPCHEHLPLGMQIRAHA